MRVVKSFGSSFMGSLPCGRCPWFPDVDGLWFLPAVALTLHALVTSANKQTPSRAVASRRFRPNRSLRPCGRQPRWRKASSRSSSFLRSSRRAGRAIPSSRGRPSRARAGEVLDFLNSAETAEQIAAAVEIPGEPDVGVRIAQRILDRRGQLGTFTDLRQVADVPLVGPERFTEIVTTLSGARVPK